MNILGFGNNINHDPSAALVIDGRVVAAAEEERFCRVKHAEKRAPIESARYCLEAARLGPSDIDVVAVPWSAAVFDEHWRRDLTRTLLRRPQRALRLRGRGRRQLARRARALDGQLRELGIDPAGVKIDWVEHHLAHASSSYHCSGFDAAAVLSVDGQGEITTTLFGRARAGKIEKFHEILRPDSLGMFYSAMTEYLGFHPLDAGKTMGMASYGDPFAVDLSRFLRPTSREFRLDTRYFPRSRRRRLDGTRLYSQRLIDLLGPPRRGDGLAKPYVDIAAATQRIFEETALRLVDVHLADELGEHGTLVFAGGCALNITLNRALLSHPLVQRLWIQPAAGDSGLSLGAATYAASTRGQRIEPLRSAALGPEFSGHDVEIALEGTPSSFGQWRVEDPAGVAAAILADGLALGWFQGRMEWGPRALGQRSILGHPGRPGMSDEINRAIKFREPWRPFCPSVLEERAGELFEELHPSPFMNLSFDVREDWKSRVAEIVHVDGSARPQFVNRELQPRFHALIDAFRERTGLPCVLNTSLNRRGEPLVCRPQEALVLLEETGLEVLIIEDRLVAKEARVGDVERILATLEATRT